jgi:hypothetical protein
MYHSRVLKKFSHKNAMQLMEEKRDFAKQIESEHEITDDIDKYLCYTNENMRFFNVDF